MRLRLLAAAALAACQVGGVEPEPILGEAPAVIAVWPMVGDQHAERSELLLTGVDGAVRRRGYRVIAPSVTAQLLGDAGLGELLFAPWSEIDPGLIGRTVKADAVLVLTVNQLDLDGDEVLVSARWDLGWDLWSTRGHGRQWWFRHNGNWQQSSGDRGDPLRRFDETPDIVPIGGNRSLSFRNGRELAHFLHRLAMDHLPVAAPRDG